MTKRVIDADALLEAMKKFHIPDNEYIVIKYIAFMVDLINELATPAEQQESIFDGDGWCWDMYLAPDNENVIFYIINFNLKTKRATTGMRIDKDFYFAKISERDMLNAWRPLPNLPEDK